MRKKTALPSYASRQYLSNIPGSYIVDAMDLLPPCEPGAASQQLTIDVPFGGTFRVTFRPTRQKHEGWATRWFWVPSNAEPL